PDLLMAVLGRAIADRRPLVVLGAVRALGDLAEVRAARPAGGGVPVLVRALNYPDRRVQMAAVEALLNIPGSPIPGTARRVVEVLRRNLAAQPGPTALVAHPNPDRGNEI